VRRKYFHNSKLLARTVLAANYHVQLCRQITFESSHCQRDSITPLKTVQHQVPVERLYLDEDVVGVVIPDRFPPPVRIVLLVDRVRVGPTGLLVVTMLLGRPDSDHPSVIRLFTVHGAATNATDNRV
jgi:hypothetical protein